MHHREIEYSTELFDETTIRRMVSHFQYLLQGICANPETCLDDLPLLSDAERHQQLFAYNQTAYSDPALDLCVHELFEAQVLSSPILSPSSSMSTRFHIEN